MPTSCVNQPLPSWQKFVKRHKSQTGVFGNVVVESLFDGILLTPLFIIFTVILFLLKLQLPTVNLRLLTSAHGSNASQSPSTHWMYSAPGGKRQSTGSPNVLSQDFKCFCTPPSNTCPKKRETVRSWLCTTANSPQVASDHLPIQIIGNFYIKPAKILEQITSLPDSLQSLEYFRTSELARVAKDTD